MILSDHFETTPLLQDSGQHQADGRQEQIRQQDAQVLFFSGQIVKGNDIVIDVIRHAAGQKGRVLPLHAGEFQLGDLQPVQPQPGQDGEQDKQQPQAQGQVGKGSEARGRGSEEMDQLRREQGQDAAGKDLVNQRADQVPAPQFPYPANQQKSPLRVYGYCIMPPLPLQGGKIQDTKYRRNAQANFGLHLCIK